MEIGQKSAIKYRRFDFIGKLYEDFKNLTNFNRTFFSKLISQRSILLLGVIDITPKKQILNKKLIIEVHQ